MIAAVSCLLFSVAAMRLNPRFSPAFAAQPQAAQPAAATPQAPQLQPANATLSPTQKPADIPSLQPSSLHLSLLPSSSQQPRLQFSLEPSLPALSASATEIYTAK